MKHILLTGASGTLGRFIAERLLNDGHTVTCLGRSDPKIDGIHYARWDLGQENVTLPPADALVHAALFHEPGKYRGGEGDDPHTFIEMNVGGAIRLFDAAKRAGVAQSVFLSSGTVYADAGNWKVLKEDAELGPDSLYGEVKIAGEMALENQCDDAMRGTVLRVAGVYGLAPGKTSHKWSGLFMDCAASEPLEPNLTTEVHGEDLAAAVALVLDRDEASQPVFDIFNVSDILLDRQDLLRLFSEKADLTAPLPSRAPGPLGVLEPGKLKVLGWNPGGMAKLEAFVAEDAASLSSALSAVRKSGTAMGDGKAVRG